ncbi:transcriptional regulator family: Zinc finger, MIZ-type [Paecilomyces variotii]|nr:transcriptional regulator family: Zinc finger, MIZ-type [Paecilomyces variotii]KAJ9260224.1 transcriptional regulator family: Zinc finger, MIZ-type [Paecilomyces variotii]KAJ9277065.1 transcriptional regulator family: Zinc finger, MIZ-type [Paecilomyces variotii]KAJ9339373.1 transcriptional regulator family: Zinc finger, MIZ-type [Paecilomyces variotii]KAJ9393244.1 transcriptional regulator family: Zinc finger, MIZ-type [Paecilomyces variotii]
MSAREQQNGQTFNTAAGRAFETSNSTLNKFLGGTRKAWMSGGAPPHHHPPTPTRNKVNSQNRPVGAPGQISSPASTTPANAQRPSNGPAALQTVSSTITTDSTPISPITPVQKHSNIPVSIKQSPPFEPPLPDRGLPSAARDVGQISVLPSPEPSNGSRTSPAVVVDAERGNREAELMVLQSRLGQVESVSAVNGSQAGNTESFAATCEADLAASGSVQPQSMASLSTHQAVHRDKRPRIETARLPVSHTAPSPVGLAENQTFGASSPSASSDDNFWDCYLSALSQLEKASWTFSLSESVELPRVRLLQEACRSKDLFYVTLHQVFCLHTFALSEFARLTGFSTSQASALEIIKQLLLDNRRLSGDFLKWCVNFPFPMSRMLQNVKYRGTLQQIGQSLSLLSVKWVSFEQEIRRRSYPPLIDELVLQFHITSSTLQSVIFTAICRRHLQARDDDRLRQFLSLFERNRKYYLRRFADPQHPVSTEHMQKENEDLIRGYHSLWVQFAPRNEIHPAPSHSPVATQRAGQMASGAVPAAPAHATSPARNSVRPSLQSPPIQQLPSQSYSQSIAPSQAPPAHGRPNAPANPTGLGPNNLVSPIQMPAGQHIPQDLSPTYFPQQGVASQGQYQNSPQFQSPHYMPPAYIVPSQQMPSQMTRTPQIAQPSRGRGRPRRVPSHIQTSAPVPVVSSFPAVSPMDNRFIPNYPATQMVQRQPAAALPSPRQGPIDRHLLPAPGALPPPRAHPSPLYASIHQLHLRDPARRLVHQGPNGEEEGELFQYLHSFAVKPTCLGQTEIIFRFTFDVSNDTFRKLPQDTRFPDGRRATRVLSNGNRLYRLRCVKVAPSSQDIGENSWAIAESVWPSVFYLHVNGKEMFVRRKAHHAKDLPLDITPNLKEGNNEFTLHFLRSPEERGNLVYALAVEVLEIADLEHTKKLVQPLAAPESRLQIQKRLSVSTADDELSVVNDYIAIGLVDPFMARIFDVPARGRTCKHQECFDLDAFLSTRVSKSGSDPMKENWKCPICGGDCRPSNLIIDNFLADVRAELLRSGKLEETRAIHVKADGTWQPKIDQDLKIETRVPAKRKLSEMGAVTPLRSKSESTEGTPRVAKAPEIIELD